MKQYSHDYTKPSEVESLLYSATRLMANECYEAAVERINEARQLLQEYLAQDNMVEDDDVADGWVKVSDTFNDEQLDLIRDLFYDRLHLARWSLNGFLHQEMLDIINVCQRNLDCDEYNSVSEFWDDDSGTWTERRN